METIKSAAVDGGRTINKAKKTVVGGVKEVLPIPFGQPTDEVEQQGTDVSLFDETRELLVVASAMYLLAELRQMARQSQDLESEGKDSDPLPRLLNGERLLQTPMAASTVEEVFEENKAELLTFHGERRHGCHEQLVELMNDSSIFEVFDDEQAQTNLVYAIFVDHDRQRILVAFRGSVTGKDFRVDVTAFQTTIPNPISHSQEKGKSLTLHKHLIVHKGFYGYLMVPSEGETQSKFQAIVAKVKILLSEYPSYKLATTGHSLGGALCTLFGFFVAAQEKDIPSPVTCVSFASPMVGTLLLRRAFEVCKDTASDK